MRVKGAYKGMINEEIQALLKVASGYNKSDISDEMPEIVRKVLEETQKHQIATEVDAYLTTYEFLVNELTDELVEEIKITEAILSYKDLSLEAQFELQTTYLRLKELQPLSESKAERELTIAINPQKSIFLENYEGILMKTEDLLTIDDEGLIEKALKDFWELDSVAREALEHEYNQLYLFQNKVSLMKQQLEVDTFLAEYELILKDALVSTNAISLEELQMIQQTLEQMQDASRKMLARQSEQIESIFEEKKVLQLSEMENQQILNMKRANFLSKYEQLLINEIDKINKSLVSQAFAEFYQLPVELQIQMADFELSLLEKKKTLEEFDLNEEQINNVILGEVSGYKSLYASIFNGNNLPLRLEDKMIFQEALQDLKSLPLDARALLKFEEQHLLSVNNRLQTIENEVVQFSSQFHNLFEKQLNEVVVEDLQELEIAMQAYSMLNGDSQRFLLNSYNHLLDLQQKLEELLLVENETDTSIQDEVEVFLANYGGLLKRNISSICMEDEVAIKEANYAIEGLSVESKLILEKELQKVARFSEKIEQIYQYKQKFLQEYSYLLDTPVHEVTLSIQKDVTEALNKLHAQDMDVQLQLTDQYLHLQKLNQQIELFKDEQDIQKRQVLMEQEAYYSYFEYLLIRDLDSIELSDKQAVEEALEQYEELPNSVKLVAEKWFKLLESFQLKCIAIEQEIEQYQIEYAEVLKLPLKQLTQSDGEKIQQALKDYQLLHSSNKNVLNELFDHLMLLDQRCKELKVEHFELQELKWQAINDYKDSYKDILKKNVKSITLEMESLILEAISAFYDQPDSVKIELTKEIEKLNSMSRILIEQSQHYSDLQQQLAQIKKTPINKYNDSLILQINEAYNLANRLREFGYYLEEEIGDLDQVSKQLEIFKGHEMQYQQTQMYELEGYKDLYKHILQLTLEDIEIRQKSEIQLTLQDLKKLSLETQEKLFGQQRHLNLLLQEIVELEEAEFKTAYNELLNNEANLTEDSLFIELEYLLNKFELLEPSSRDLLIVQHQLLKQKFLEVQQKNFEAPSIYHFKEQELLLTCSTALNLVLRYLVGGSEGFEDKKDLKLSIISTNEKNKVTFFLDEVL